MQWAERTDFGEGTSELALAVESWKAQGRPLLDLTISNPTRCGFNYNTEALLRPLQNTANLQYAAEPFGPLQTRQAIAEQYYVPKGLHVTPERMVLTASTSEAYGYLFRLLCNPGDEVLVPSPSYPLFDLLAQLHDVKLIHYPLQMHDGWSVDVQALDRLRTGRTRAIVIVHPNNPTGHFTGNSDRASLGEFACRNNLALIVDEVFLDYALIPAGESFLHDDTPALTFVLSGLSKVLALPQMKLAWTVVHGPDALCEEALRRLEFIADTFLPLSAPVANATAHWLPLAGDIQNQLCKRILVNLQTLDEVIRSEPLLGRLTVEGGWSVLLRIPALEADEITALRLLEIAGILVHPGSFYGLPGRGFLVVSLLVPESDFQMGVNRLATVLGTMVNDVPKLQTIT